MQEEIIIEKNKIKGRKERKREGKKKRRKEKEAKNEYNYTSIFLSVIRKYPV